MGKRTGRPPVPAVERFLAQIDIDGQTGCWLWTGSVDKNGYGKFNVRVATNQHRDIRAHVFAYEQWGGPIPEGLVLDHFVCDTPPCANPDHVRPATNRENILRGTGVAAKNARKTHCDNGHEFTPGNTYAHPPSRDYPHGRRSCRVCRRAAVRRHRLRKGNQ